MCTFFFYKLHSFILSVATVIFQPAYEQKTVDELCSSQESLCVGVCDVDVKQVFSVQSKERWRRWLVA